MADAQTLFSRYSRGRPTITTSELADAIKNSNPSLTGAQIEALQASAEVEYKGQINLQAFQSILHRAKDIETRDGHAAKAFGIFTANGKPQIVDVDSMRHALTTLGGREALTHEEIDTILTDAGGEDENGHIQMEKLLALIQTVV